VPVVSPSPLAAAPRPRRPRAAVALGAALLIVPAGAAAQEAAILEGLVLDEGHRPVESADVLVTDAGGSRLGRRAAISDDRGRFHLGALPGLVRVVVQRRDGAVIAARLVELAPGIQFLIAMPDDGGAGQGIGAPAPELALAAGGQAVPAAAAPGGALLLVRERDLGGLVELLPAGAPSAPAALGPGLAGMGAGEIEVSLDGLIDLRDPVDATAPLELPLALLGAADARHTWPAPGALGDVVAGEARGGAALFLTSRGRAGARLVARTGGALAAPSGGPRAGAGFVEVEANHLLGDRHRNGAHLRLALAPRWNEPGLDPAAPAGEGRRVRQVLPALARAAMAWRGWELEAVGLATRLRDDHEPPGRIAPLAARAHHVRSLLALGAEARRPFGGGGPAVVALSASGLWTASELLDRGGQTVVTDGRRLAVGARVQTAGEVLGKHVARAAFGVALAHAERRGLLFGRSAGDAAASPASGASASGTDPFAVLDDRWRPWPWIELELGLGVSSSAARGERTRGGVASAIALGTRPLVAPRLGLRLVHRRSGSGLFAAAGRFGAPLPLEPLLETGEGNSAGALTIPHEDAALAGLELRRPWAVVALTAVERRTRALIEDRFSPLTGQLTLVNPANVSRRWRALSLQAALMGERTLVGLSYTLASLSGAYAGYADPGAAAVRPGSTATFDAPEVDVNRGGPLPLDRRHTVRLGAAGRGRWRQHWLAAAAVGRLDDGVPVTAVGRSALSGAGQSFLVPRGSLGRTPWRPALDLGVSAARVLGSRRLTVAVEAFNVTAARPAIARHQAYTDEVAIPVPGATREMLGATIGPTGETVRPAPDFLRDAALAEPLLVRLSVTVEM
jgi:hypothetical protein